MRRILLTIASMVCLGIGFALEPSEVFGFSDTSDTSRIGVLPVREPVEAAIIESLCRMGLYETAIRRCRSGIVASATGTLQHARWSSLLIASLAERDSEKAASIDEALREPKKIYSAFTADSKNQAYQVWVDYSYEVVRFNLANRSVANYLAAPTNKARRDDALNTVRVMLDHLVEMKVAAHNQLGTALRRTDRESPALVRDLGSLHNRLSLLEIDCMLLRCDCYPHGSDERIAGGTEALAAIDKITGRIESDWSGQELLDLARNQSLIALSRYADAAQSLTKWLPTVGDPTLRHRGIALLAKAHQLQGDFGLAAKSLLSASSNALEESPEIALATLELQIGSWKKHNEASSNSQRTADESHREIERILQLKEQIANRFGNYWRQRAEALIVGSSLGESTASNDSSQPTSLELLKVNIRQRLAAGDFSGAIELLDQAEAASLASNDLKQAFAFAKNSIGVMQQQFTNIEPMRHENTQAIIDRVSKTAKKYSSQEASAALHQSAIERQHALIATDASSEVSRTANDVYKQMLIDHVMTWPDDQSSDENRRRLQTLYLGIADLQSLVDLWSEELSWLEAAPKESISSDSTQYDLRLETANVNFVNARLLSRLAVELHIDRPAETNVAVDSSLASQWLLDALSADYDWWTVDGGIQQTGGKSIDWAPPSRAVEVFQLADAIQKILRVSTQSEWTNITPEVERVVEWTRADVHGRIAWLATLNSKVSDILRLRQSSDIYQPASREWLDSLILLHGAMLESLQKSENVLHPSLLMTMKEYSAIFEARTDVLRGDVELGASKIAAYRQANARNPRWTLELARLYEMQDASTEKALQLYRQLAAGSPSGSEVWFESRLSSVRCLRRQKKPVDADQIIALVQAMVVEVPEKWKRRLK